MENGQKEKGEKERWKGMFKHVQPKYLHRVCQVPANL